MIKKKVSESKKWVKKQEKNLRISERYKKLT